MCGVRACVRACVRVCVRVCPHRQGIGALFKSGMVSMRCREGLKVGQNVWASFLNDPLSLNDVEEV